MPPNNAVYYHVAYILATTIYAGYAFFIYARWKRARATMKLEEK